MLKSFSAKNFRTLDGEKIEFEPLTFLVGPNASGKSNILKAIKALGEICSDLPHYYLGRPEMDKRWKAEVWKGDLSLQMSFSAVFEDREGKYADYKIMFQKTLDGHGITEESLKTHDISYSMTDKSLPQRHILQHKENNIAIIQWLRGNQTKEVQKIRKYLPELFGPVLSPGIFMFDPRMLAEPSKLGMIQLHKNGRNFPSFLEDMKEDRDPDSFEAIQEKFKKIFPFVTRITIPTVDGNSKTISFWEGEKKYAPDLEGFSDGMVMVMAYLSVAMDPNAPSLLCIEEPENFLHPRLMGFMVDFFRKLTTRGKEMKPLQIIITTHSPILLDHAKPEEVRIVRRTEEGRTKVKAVKDIPGWERLFKAYDKALGDLWFSGSLESLVDKA